MCELSIVVSDTFLGALKVCISDELLDICIEYDVVGSTKKVKYR